MRIVLPVGLQANMVMVGQASGSAGYAGIALLVTVSRRGRDRPNPAQPSQTAQTTGCLARMIRGGKSTVRAYPAAKTQNPNIQATNCQSRDWIRGGKNRIRGGENTDSILLDPTRPVAAAPSSECGSSTQHSACREGRLRTPIVKLGACAGSGEDLLAAASLPLAEPRLDEH